MHDGKSQLVVVAGKENAIPVKTAAASDGASCSNRSHNPAAASHTAAGGCSHHQHGDVTCAPAATASQHHHHAPFSSNTLSQHSHSAAGATTYTCTAGYSTLSVTGGVYAGNQHTSAAYVTDQYSASTTTTSWCSSAYNSYTNGSTSQVPPSSQQVPPSHQQVPPSSQQADITLPPPAMQYHVNDVNNHMLYPGTCNVFVCTRAALQLCFA